MDAFWQSEGMRLEKEAIKYDAAKRGLTKLCLNLMWGKLKERNDLTLTKIITEPKDLYGFLVTPGVEVMNLAFASDDVLYISWKYGAEEDVPYLRHTKEVMGITSSRVQESFTIATSTGCERTWFIVTRTLSYTFSREVNHH